MFNILGVVFTCLVCWFLWKLLGFVWRWEQSRRLFSDIPLVDNHHWFWGLSNQATNIDDYMPHFLNTMERRKDVKWLSAWILCFEPLLVPCHPDTIRQFLSATHIPKSHGWNGAYRMFSSWVGEGLIVANGQKWERDRHLLTPVFHFDKLKSYIETFNTVADAFLENIHQSTRDGSSIDLYPFVSRATMDSMLRCVMSYSDSNIQTQSGDEHPYVAATRGLSRLLVERVVNPLVYLDAVYFRTQAGKEFKRLHEITSAFSSKIIQARKQTMKIDGLDKEQRHLDFLDMILSAEDEHGQGLTDQEILDEVANFMFAGHDTTASAISWTLYALAKYPSMQSKVRAEIDTVLNGNKHPTVNDITKFNYTTCFIKEVLRMYSPVPALGRKLARPLTIMGKTFPANQTIDFYPHFVHHNPAVWENHMEFIPERFFPENSVDRDPFAFVAFSAGQRNCIGQHFAMNEIKTFVASTVSRFTIHIDEDRPSFPFAKITTISRDGIFLYFKER